MRFERQLDYNWHGKAIAYNYLDEFCKELKLHREGSKTPEQFREGIGRLVRRLEKLGAKQIDKPPED